MALRRFSPSGSIRRPRPARRSWPARVGPGVALALALVAGCGGSDRAGSDGTEAQPANGADAADAATATTPGPAAGPADQVVLHRFSGEPVSLADYRGRPLVVNFFASWCAPCIKEMPEFERVHQDLGDEVAFLGVNVRDRAEDGRRLADQTGVTFDLVRDPRGDLLVAVGGNAMPTTAFVGADGRLALVQSRNYNAESLRAAIDEVLLAPPEGTGGPAPTAVSR